MGVRYEKIEQVDFLNKVVGFRRLKIRLPCFIVGT